MIAAILLAASAPAGAVLTCEAAYDNGQARPFRISFARRGSSVRNLAFEGDAPTVFGNWRGRFRDGRILFRNSKRGMSSGEMTMTPRSDGRFGLTWSSTYGGGCIWFVDEGTAICSLVSGNIEFEAQTA